jgi:hypothetical protein
VLSKLKSFYSTSWNRKKLFFQVLILSIYRAFLIFIGSPKAFTENVIKNSPPQKDAELTYDQHTQAKDIAFAIELGRKYIPWKNLCRHQAWQAVYLLQKAEIPFTYHVGVKINEPKRGEGHAWVMVNGKFVSGKCRLSDYKEITFEKKF